MLAVSIHKHQYIPLCGACAGFDSRAIAFAVGVMHYARARCLGHGSGVVGGAVVDYQHFYFAHYLHL